MKDITEIYWIIQKKITPCIYLDCKSYINFDDQLKKKSAYDLSEINILVRVYIFLLIF